jgi:hypothetical protein
LIPRSSVETTPVSKLHQTQRKRRTGIADSLFRVTTFFRLVSMVILVGQTQHRNLSPSIIVTQESQKPQGEADVDFRIGKSHMIRSGGASCSATARSCWKAPLGCFLHLREVTVNSEAFESFRLLLCACEFYKHLVTSIGGNSLETPLCCHPRTSTRPAPAPLVTLTGRQQHASPRHAASLSAFYKITSPSAHP